MPLWFSLPTDPANPDEIENIDLLVLDLSALQIATDNFAENKRLGEGGFGVVYKVYHKVCL